jgi:hypothetical protein
MKQKTFQTQPKSAIDPLQLQLLQHNVHLDTLKVLTSVLQASTPNTLLHDTTSTLILQFLEPFKHGNSEPITDGESSAD